MVTHLGTDSKSSNFNDATNDVITILSHHHDVSQHKTMIITRILTLTLTLTLIIIIIIIIIIIACFTIILQHRYNRTQTTSFNTLAFTQSNMTLNILHEQLRCYKKPGPATMP